MIAPLRRALALALALAALGCPIRGDGIESEEARTITAAIDRLEVFDGFAVAVTLDPARDPGADVIVRGDANLLATITTEVHSQSVLSVGLQPTQESHPVAPLSASVTTSALTSFFAGNRATLTIDDLAAAHDLRLRDQAAAELGLVAGATLAVDAREEASVHLHGAADSIDLVVADAATVDAADLVAAAIHVDLQGSGAVVVCATGEITGVITGATVLEIVCEPALVDIEIQGEGAVRTGSS